MIEADAPLLTQRDGVFGRIVLNRPDVRNALNDTLVTAIVDAVDAFVADDSVRAIAIFGAGKHFCAGADLNEMAASANHARGENLEAAARLRRVFESLFHCPKITIAFVHGSAVGGGAGLAASCDIVVARASATFAFPEVKLGVVPALISPFVARRIGPSNARRLFLTGETFDADEAFRIGLVDRILADDDPLFGSPDALFGDTIAATGPDAVARCKRLLHALETVRPEDIPAVTIEALADARASDEAKERLAAFLAQKSRPG